MKLKIGQLYEIHGSFYIDKFRSGSPVSFEIKSKFV